MVFFGLILSFDCTENMVIRNSMLNKNLGVMDNDLLTAIGFHMVCSDQIANTLQFYIQSIQNLYLSKEKLVIYLI